MMRKILGLVLVASLSVALAAPASAARGGGGGFHGGSHHGFHHHDFHHHGFHRFGCCFGTGFVGGVFVAAPPAYPLYAYPYVYPVYSAPVYQQQPQVTVAPSVQREVCYVGGCYHLEGDGVTVAYQWIWVPSTPAPPPGPPSQ